MNFITQNNDRWRPGQRITAQSNFKPHSMRVARSAIIYGLALSTSMLFNVATHAKTTSQKPTQDQDPLEDSIPTAIFPTITVKANSRNDNTYSGDHVSYTSHMGFLGDKDFLLTPFNTISYTDTFIKDTQATDISDVIAKTDPSVYSSEIEGQNLESYKIRGFDSSISDVTVNGLYGVAPRYRSSPEMFQQVEVLKGPSAMLNGMAPNGSVGGAINLVTKRADDKPLTQVTARLLSDSQLGGHLDIGRRFGNKNQFGVRFNGVYRDGDSPINNQTKEAQLAAVALDWKGERLRLSADLYDSQENVDGPTRGMNLAPGVALPEPLNADTLLNPDWAFNDSEDTGGMARGEFDINDDLMFYSTFGFSNNTFESRSAAVSTLMDEAGDYETTIGDLKDRSKERSGEVGLIGELTTGNIEHQIAINATGYKDTNNLAGNFYPNTIKNNLYSNLTWASFDEPFTVPELLETQTRMNSYGVADTLSFDDDKYQLTLGVRHQQVKTEESGKFASGKDYDESATTPGIAALVQLSDNLSIYANYIEGLTKGQTAPVAAINAGETFEPYETEQKEIGVKVDLGQFAHTLSVFDIQKPNAYVDPISKIYKVDGEQKNRGVEWGFFGSPLQNVQLMGGVTYIDAELSKGDKQGKQPMGVPEWQAKLGAEWEQPYIENLTLTGNVSAISDQYVDSDNLVSIPGHTIIDLGARYKTSAWKHPITLRSDIKNITDKKYWTKPHYTTLGLGAPRTVLLSATVDF